MRAFRSLLSLASLAVTMVALPAGAQEGHEAVEGPSTGVEHVDIITPHITDSHFIEVPTLFPPFAREVCIGHRVSEHECEALWKPVQIAGYTVDLSPTKHVVMLLFGALLISVLLIGTARAHRRHTHEVGHPKGFAAGIEAMVLYMRNEVILPNVGHHGNGFVPFLLSIFFFILTANLLGLVPYGSTATGNIAVTATLAIITFVVVEIAGMRAQGMGYLSTLFYWNNDLPMVMRVPMFLIMSPVEMIGKITKPFALAIRLFANMTAGHIVVLAFIGLIFTFAGPISVAPFLMAVAIMLLEIFVAFLQAFIFTLLASVFIGQIRESHH